ncbi:cyclase family protein [Chloroflexota bacterium]
MAYKLFDLSHPHRLGAPMWPRLAPDAGAFAGVTAAGIRDWPCVRGTLGAAVPGTHFHGGTHMDAPIYCIDYGAGIDTIPLENCYGTGVVVDFRNKKKWDKITAEDFEKATPKIEPGDFVVCNTGWQKWYRKEDYVYYHHYPGLVPSAAEWLIKKKVKAIAGTWATLDHSLAFPPLNTFMPWLYNEYKTETGKDPIGEFPNYEPCLPMLIKAGITCIQNAGGVIDEVTGKRCKLLAFPIRLTGGADASMVRLVAIVEG